MQPLEISDNDRILIIAPHPDDECIGAGGLLALYHGRCEIWVMTDGRQGQGDRTSEEERTIRKNEFEDEMRILDISSYRFWGYADGTLMQQKGCFDDKRLDRFSKIFVTGLNDNHADHMAACRYLADALRKQGNDSAEVYVYEVHAMLQTPTHFLDITSVMEEKLRLIRCHRSQLSSLKYDESARCMAELRAIQSRKAGCYYETYQRMRSADVVEDSTFILQDELQKSRLFYWVLTRWVKMKNEGHSCAYVLKKRGIHSIAVYGYAEIGKLLCEELIGTDIEVRYIIDKKVEKSEDDSIKVYIPQENLPDVDAVIVTVIYYYDEIRSELEKLGLKNIISFGELI